MAKATGKVLWLALRPFDTLQNAIGALGVIINLLVSLGSISGSGIIGWVYFPQNTQISSHNWLPAIIFSVSALTVFILIAAVKLQFEKDKLNDIIFTVNPLVHNRGAILEVTNQAQIAKFRATGRVLEDVHHESELYRLFWDGFGGEVELGNGDTAGIIVARQEVISTNPFLIGLQMIKSTPEGLRFFNAGIFQMQNGLMTKAAPLYMEIVIKPISSSKKQHKAHYVIEQPQITDLVFRKVDSIPSTSHR